MLARGGVATDNIVNSTLAKQKIGRLVKSFFMTERGCGRPKHHCKVKQNVITMENAGGYYPAFRHKHNAPIDRKSLSVAAALTSSKKSARILVCCPFRYLRLWNCPSELNGQRRSLTQNIPPPSGRRFTRQPEGDMYIST